MYSNILVAVDGSEISLHAFEQAVELAKLSSAKLHVIYVIDVNIRNPGPNEPAGEIIYRRFEEEGTNAMEEVKKIAAEKGIEVDTILEAGRAGDLIVKTAKKLECDLVVTGSLGKSKLDQLFLGSVSTYVAKNVKTNLLIVRK